MYCVRLCGTVAISQSLSNISRCQGCKCVIQFLPCYIHGRVRRDIKHIQCSMRNPRVIYKATRPRACACICKDIA